MPRGATPSRVRRAAIAFAAVGLSSNRMIVGIDLGTTNSLIGSWRNGKTELFPTALRSNLTPSVVGLDDNGEILVGQPAKERMLTHPDLTQAVFKRYMGTQRTMALGKRSYRAEELSSFVLRSLKRDAEEFTGEKVAEAVISVPAYFSDAQRKATKIAGELAGLKVERLINEPTAAALAYGLQDAPPESQFLVFDLGGGTFDVTILQLFDGVMEVRASAGDNFLGGEDFVDVLIDKFVGHCSSKKFLTANDVQRDPKLRKALRYEAEKAKRQLTESSETVMAFAWKGGNEQLRITDTDLKTWAEPLLSRIRQPVERALRDARIMPSELHQILLVGGATRMPLIRNLVARLFGRFPTTEIHPDEAVALGAAVQAGLKARDAALKEVVLTDVCPYSLGVEVAHQSEAMKTMQSGYFSPIIQRNTVIPASRVEQYVTTQDWQTAVNMNIYQGEARLVKDNILLGKVVLKVPRKKRGEEKIDVRFTYDINGLLEVEATVVSTGTKKVIVIEETPGVLSADEIKARLATLSALKISPTDQVENRTVMARAERLYEQSLGLQREWIGSETSKFEEVMARQDPNEISKARAEFSSFLDSMDGQSPLGSNPS
jgi:molecular chaperone HscC